MSQVLVRTFVREAAYIGKCCAHHDAYYIAKLFFRSRTDLTPEVFTEVIEEIKAVCADFYVVSGDTEIQMRRAVPDIAAIFVLRPSLVFAWITATSASDSLAKLLHIHAFDKHPPLSFFRTQIEPRVRRTAWSFAAVVSHATREHVTDKSIPRTLPLYFRTVRWMEENVSDWRTSIPGIMLVDEVIRAVRHRRNATKNVGR